jgi:uncharacterized NAD(P)/FAD-binding protein YdhS
MTKELKSKSDLSALMLERARSSGKCNELEDVIVVGPVTRPYTNWDFGTQPFVKEDACRIELQIIAADLQQKYDLVVNAEAK